MPQAPRKYKSGVPYEIFFRARRGLPFTVKRYMRQLIESVLARTQRDFKVTLCHHIWMGNHPHILAVFKDAELAKRFYTEVQKKLTDAIKRYLGVNYLNLWAKTPRVIEIGDLKTAIKVIAYYYANPSKANLVERIEEYPGVSSWGDFVANMDRLDAKASKECPWIRLWSISKLPGRVVSEVQDLYITKRMEEANRKETHMLEVYPNAWMSCFGVTSDEEVRQINEQIVARLRHNEDVCKRWRERKGFKVLGVKYLQRQPIMAEHEPKKRGRRIFCMASTKQLRVQLIHEFKEFCKECRRCYKAWRDGNVLVAWPPGAFLPPLTPRANALEPG